MLLVLILAGTAALNLALPVALAIAALAAIVATSYVQLVKAYPGGGGAYAVTKENLGVKTSLLTGSTLFVDYVLTVAVSTAAGVAAITSALPELRELRIEMAVGFVTLLTLGNLRGIRESGSLFAIPPYLFILGFGAMLVVGIVRIALGHDLQPSATADAFEAGAQACHHHPGSAGVRFRRRRPYRYRGDRRRCAVLQAARGYERLDNADRDGVDPRQLLRRRHLPGDRSSTSSRRTTRRSSPRSPAPSSAKASSSTSFRS